MIVNVTARATQTALDITRLSRQLVVISTYVFMYIARKINFTVYDQFIIFDKVIKGLKPRCSSSRINSDCRLTIKGLFGTYKSAIPSRQMKFFVRLVW